MKIKSIALAVTLLAYAIGVEAKQQVSIAGWGGSDVIVMNKLINEVLVDELNLAKISLKYMPVEGEFTPYIFNALSAGTAPDLFYVDVLVYEALANSGKLMSNEGALVDLQSSILPSLNRAFILGGKQYGMPKDFNSLALVYNKDIFDKASVDYSSSNDNWSGLATKLKKVKEALGDDIATICVVPDYARFASFALSTGWRPFNDNNKTVLDNNFRRAMTFYTSLVTELGGAMPADVGQSWGGACLGSEATAIAIEGNWIATYLRDKAPNMQYGAVMMPVDDETGERGNLLFTVAWGINADSKNRDAAQKVVEILTSKKAQSWVLESGLALPSRSELSHSPFFSKSAQENKLAKVIFDSASNGHVEPYSFGQYGSAWALPINEALGAVLLKQMSVDQAIKIAQEKYDVMYTQSR